MCRADIYVAGQFYFISSQFILNDFLFGSSLREVSIIDVPGPGKGLSPIPVVTRRNGLIRGVTRREDHRKVSPRNVPSFPVR